MKMLLIFLIPALLSIFIISCKKPGQPPAPPALPATPGYTTYISGNSGSNPVYWKDGLQVDLGGEGNADCLAINGSDIFVGGYIGFGFDSKAAYWKNGQPFLLESTGTSHVKGIAVNGNDVYCAGDKLGFIGSGRDSAIYWENEVPHILSYVSNGVANSINIFGSTIYIEGSVNNYAGDSAIVWRNGIPAWYSIPGEMVGMGVSPNDTFFIGRGGTAAYYYTSHAATKLSDVAYVSGIAFNSNDVYIGGTISVNDSSHAGYWKNDVFVPLLPTVKYSYVEGIAAAGADIYAVGFYILNNVSVPVCWKNGTAIALGTNGEATAISIVKN